MPTLVYYGNGVQTRFEVPGSVKKTVWVNGVGVTPASQDFQSVTLSVAPGSKVPVQIEWDADGRFDQASPDGAGSVTSGVWRGVPPVTMRLRMSGVGTVVMDAASGPAGTGTVTGSQFSFSPTGPQVDEYAYPGDSTCSIRITLTGTATCEVI